MRAIGPNSFPEEDNELLHTPLFKQVSPEQANELIPYLHEAVFDKGDYIFREGDKDHRMYLLERGRVKLIRESKDRRVQLLSIHAHGELLGEIPVFDPSGGPRTGRGDDPRHARGMAGA
jgi:CRP/FNR family cyclic AMP-dependent transcriptional regulator